MQTVFFKYILPWMVLFMVGMGHAKAQSVIPIPLKMEQGEGSFLLTEDTKFYTNLKGKEGTMLTDYLETLPIKLTKGSKNTRTAVWKLLIKRRDTRLATPESYTLQVTPSVITLEATSAAGLFYGVQSLLQLMQPVSEGTWSIPAVSIEDSPRLPYRGFMMDVSRHFRSKEFVKKQMDVLAYYKLNRLHLHLTDAAGWRIEIKKYPRLTDFAAWRPEANWKKWWMGEQGRKYIDKDQPGATGGYYTQDDIRELVKYAAERHITLIPEIEMPAHSEEVLAAYPELSCQGKPYTSADYCIGNEETFTFLQNVLTEVMELFPSEYIHIGGDEAGKVEWKNCPKCQQRMKDEHLTNLNELQSYLIHRIEVFLNSKGRKLLGWDEIMDGGLPPKAAVMSWRGEQRGIDAVKAGHPAIMTPGTYCYIDFYQDAPLTQPEAIGGYTPLSKIYSYNPIPATLTTEEAKLIMGVQANLWAEYIEKDKDYERMMYPRLLALAEVGWSIPERKSYEDFHKRALQAVEYLQSKGYHPFELKNEVGNRVEAATPVKHLALGKTVTYNAPYNSSYPAQGDKSLTDGIRGSWTYSDGAWQGFISAKRLDVTLDMGAVTDLHSIAADFMQMTGPEVFLPAEVIISVSDDGVEFKELIRHTQEVNRDTPIAFRNFAWGGHVRARYIRYQALAGAKYGGWIFTDEIVVN